MAKSKPTDPTPSASAPESDAAKSSGSGAPTSTAAVGATETATAISAASAQTNGTDSLLRVLRPNDVDVLNRAIQVILAARLKVDLISLRDRLAETLGVPPHYPNTK